MLGVVLAAATTATVALPAQNVFASFKQGQSGPEVAAIQEQLLMEGYDIGIPDGVYGARTVAAVKKYQASMGLAADGVIGNFTYKKLMGKDPPHPAFQSELRQQLWVWQQHRQSIDQHRI